MRTTSASFVVSFLSCLLLITCDLQGATSDQIQRAIDKGKQFIYSKQQGDNWETGAPRTDKQEGGVTAFAVYTLLAAGESPQDPKIKPAINYLLKVKMKGVYALGMRCQVWSLIPSTPEVRDAARKDAAALMETLRVADQNKRGKYDYVYDSGPGYYDHSASQFGVLGMWALAQMGLEISGKYWQTVDAAWRRDQDPSGGWWYAKTEGAKVRPSMTAAGVATLFITVDQLNYGKASQCKGNIADANIDRGMKWMADNLDAAMKDFYTVYGVSRIGAASGHKYIGGKDWFDQGATFIVKEQSESGAWWDSFENTCFAVLFLVRGRAPIFMNKLEYQMEGKDANWNQRPRDVANLTQWMGKQTERYLNWQIVNLGGRIEDLHDAPVLYFAGNQALKFTEDEQRKLKDFVEQGGMILGNSDCAMNVFTDSFKALGTKLFGYEFRELPEKHLIYVAQTYPRGKWKSKPSVVGLSNGARELMLLMPMADAAKAWYTMSDKGNEHLFQMPANVYQYATEMQNVRFKGERHIVLIDEKIQSTKTLKVARLQYDGNWNPEPGGWRQLNAIMHNNRKIDVATETVKLGSGKLATSFTAAHLTGTSEFKLNDTARDEISKYLQAGGTLVIDAAGGSMEFAESAERELRALLPATTSTQPVGSLDEPLPPSHDIYSDRFGPMPQVGYRPHARRTVVGQTRTPRIRGLDVNGRTAIFFSREDISVGLVGQPVDGIIGYDAKTSAELVSRMLQFADQAKKWGLPGSTAQ